MVKKKKKIKKKHSKSRLLKAPMRWGSSAVQYIQEALLGNATAG